MNLAGRVAAVIGGGGGVGRAVSLGLARAGVDVALCDIDDVAAEETRDEIAAIGRRTMVQAIDATEFDALSGFYAALGENFERLDIVVNVVGGVKREAFMDATREQGEIDIRKNYGYVVDSIRFAVPLIRRGGRGGSIINFTTIEAHRGAATFAVYAGAKAATTNFTRAVAVELAAERIRVNTLAPDTSPAAGSMGAIAAETRARVAALGPAISQEGRKMYIPMKEQPSVDALADGVLFLASDLSAFVTGTTLHVDGGTIASLGFIDWPFGDGFLPVPLDGTLSRMYADET